MATKGLPSFDGELPPNDDKGPLLLQVMWTLTGISTIVVLLRLYTKLSKARRIYWDDGLMVLALAFGLVYAAITTVSIQYGMGRHIIYLEDHSRNEALRTGVLSLGWGLISPMIARIAFSTTLLYLTSTDPGIPKWPIWLFIAIQIIINITSVIAFYTQCGSQLDIYWTPAKMPLMYTACWDPSIQTKLGYFVGAINCLTDAFLTVWPAVLIEHTKLSWKRKVGVGCLMCLSVLALVASVVKTYAVKALSQVSDYTYDLVYYVIWMTVELNVVITVSSIALIRPLFRRRRHHRNHHATPSDLGDLGKWDTTTLSSAFSLKNPRARGTALSISSQENFVPHPSPQMYEMDCPGQGNGITVTREVEVTYQPNDAPFVHAALVGLVKGEIEEERR